MHNLETLPHDPQKLHLKETGLQSEVVVQRGGRADAQSQVRKLQCDIADLAEAVQDPKALKEKVRHLQMNKHHLKGGQLFNSMPGLRVNQQDSSRDCAVKSAALNLAHHCTWLTQTTAMPCLSTGQSAVSAALPRQWVPCQHSTAQPRQCRCVRSVMPLALDPCLESPVITALVTRAMLLPAMPLS